MIVLYNSGRRIIPGWIIMKTQCGKNVHLTQQDHSEMRGVHTKNLAQSKIWNPENIFEKDKPATLEMSYFVHWIEREIKKSPTQWCWDYKKWSRKPI